MTKKTWIKLKHGLLEPKHREQMGSAIWLYMYILDICDWDTGCVEGWTDEKAAKDLDFNIQSIRYNRRKLNEAGYIGCLQKRDCQLISVTNWTNPREYSGKVYNKPNSEGVKPLTPKGGNDFNTLPYKPHLKESHTKKSTSPRKRDVRLDHPAIVTYKSVAHLNVPITWRDAVIEAVGDKQVEVTEWSVLIRDWIGHGWNKANVKGMLDAYRNGGLSRQPADALDAAMQEVFGKE